MIERIRQVNPRLENFQIRLLHGRRDESLFRHAIQLVLDMLATGS